MLLLMLMLGFLPAGCSRTASDTEVVCKTFVYSVKNGDSLRLDRYTYAPAIKVGEQAPCMIFVFGGAFIHGTRDAESYRPFFEYMARENGYTVVSIDYRLGLKEPLAAGKLSPEQRKQLDIRYAREMSPWLDLKIILRTFTAFIQKENV